MITVMMEYIGTKALRATPMNRAEYNNLRGWVLPADENGSDEGYLVEYMDGGKPNLDGFAGYVSWSPKEQFENAYQRTNAMSFGHATHLVKQIRGLKIARRGWNGKGMYLVYQKGYPNGIAINANTAEATGLKEGTVCRFLPYLMMKTADNSFVPWLASQTDILADDWEIVD